MRGFKRPPMKLNRATGWVCSNVRSGERFVLDVGGVLIGVQLGRPHGGGTRVRAVLDMPEGVRVAWNEEQIAQLMEERACRSPISSSESAPPVREAGGAEGAPASGTSLTP
jgi:hypothetical protein